MRAELTWLAHEHRTFAVTFFACFAFLYFRWLGGILIVFFDFVFVFYFIFVFVIADQSISINLKLVIGIITLK